MKKTIQVLLFLVCCLLSGCGMVATPHRVTVPHQSMQKVVVLDQDSKQLLPDASVTCQMYGYRNWMKPVPFWGVAGSTDGAQVAERPDQKVLFWQAQAQGQGVFLLEPRKKIGWTQIWFPLPLPLGWFLYRTYDGLITASAPGHSTVWISNSVATGQPVFVFGSLSEKPELFFRMEKEHVTVMLPKEEEGSE